MKNAIQINRTMTIKDLFNLAEGREPSKSYPKADGVYIWDYKLVENLRDSKTVLELIPSDSGKVGFQDKVSLQEILDYLDEKGCAKSLEEIQIEGVDGVTLAKV